MGFDTSTHEVQARTQDILGFLNFASGSLDPKFFQSVNALFQLIEASDEKAAAWQVFLQVLQTRLHELEQTSPVFQNAEQAHAVLELCEKQILPAYLKHHRDLIHHHPPSDLFRPYFIGRVFEVILQVGPPWGKSPHDVSVYLEKLNDFLGYRPVAVLETEQKIEPYAHERVRPIPLYIAGAGVATGRYQQLIQATLDILRETPPQVLDAAWFSPEMLDELAMDPRAYDFNHPANKRPNYHFGQWDPHLIDNSGNFRRFVVQQVTLDALLERLADPQLEISADEALLEAAAVLAGTILMASGTSGSGPEAHDSEITLANLLPRIAAYRDAFYSQLIARIPGEHGQRLQSEAVRLRQPFASVRQHLNQQLAHRRATQLQQVALALIFARMGYPEAAMRQARAVTVASARILCEIHCRLTAGFQATRSGHVHQAADLLVEIEDLLHRGIECGAIVDPWNILGFGGQFAVFRALENSVPDPRIDELIDLMEEIFSLYSRVWSEAAAVESDDLQHTLSARFLQLAGWWDQFAVSMVGAVKPLNGTEMFLAAEFVANAISAWRRGGAAAGDTAFWRPHAERFDSPRAYAQVIEALLERDDQIASMALLVHWISQAERISLDEGERSFHQLTLRWLRLLLAQSQADTKLLEGAASSQQEAQPSSALSNQQLQQIRKFLDYLEANAEQFWQVPKLELEPKISPAEDDSFFDEDFDPDEPLDEDEADNLFQAAYEDVTYRDSTADGHEGETLDFGLGTTDYELDFEAKRITKRLAFLVTLARIWKQTAISQGIVTPENPFYAECVSLWIEHATSNRNRLAKLLRAVDSRPVPTPGATQDSLMEYDRRRMVKETLVEKIISTTVVTWDAERTMRAMASAPETTPDGTKPSECNLLLGKVLRALLAGDARGLREIWNNFLSQAAQQPLLYVSLSKGGDPLHIVSARAWQHSIRQLLAWLPSGGFFRETCQLIRTARQMERDHPLGPGAVTEFDRLYEIGFKSIVESIIDASKHWDHARNSDAENDDFDEGELIECLRQLTEALLTEWLTHSRTLRLSVLEKISSDADWEALVTFIQRYGREIFTQKFLNLSNLRAILHQGLESWLNRVINDPAAPDWQLLVDLDSVIPRSEAQKHLGLVIEAVVENYGEYRDYNSTTTQSDRGEMLYMFLDFLRLKANYERVNWNLRPVVMAHEVLVRRGQTAAAEVWRRAMADRTSEAADFHQKRLLDLQAEYGMRLATVADRLSERFIRPLTIDRVQALIQPAIEEARLGLNSNSFLLLEAETEELASQPSGAGFELPDWLASLEEEVDRAITPDAHAMDLRDTPTALPKMLLSFSSILAQLTDWNQRTLPS